MQFPLCVLGGLCGLNVLFSCTYDYFEFMQQSPEGWARAAATIFADVVAFLNYLLYKERNTLKGNDDAKFYHMGDRLQWISSKIVQDGKIPKN